MLRKIGTCLCGKKVKADKESIHPHRAKSGVSSSRKTRKGEWCKAFDILVRASAAGNVIVT